MTLISVFYDGPVTETDHAANLAGNPSYGVYGPNDFKVTAHPSIPYAVLVKAGKAHGRKVTDTAVIDEVVQCTTLASGVRWDCIVVRRNWQPLLGGPSILVAVPAGINPVIPATLKKNPGVEDDQPLFLVKWEGGKSAPTQFIDLRCWASTGGAAIVDKLTLGYLGEPGACVILDKVAWRYLPTTNGLWDWTDMSGTASATANTEMRRDGAGRAQVANPAVAADIATKGYVDNASSASAYGFVQPSGWKLSGECRVTNLVGIKRVEMDVNIIRTGATFNLDTSFTDLGAVLANQSRGGSGEVKYLPIAISGGSGGNNKLAMAFINTSTGHIGIRSTEDKWGWVSGANATLNITYYI